MLDRLLRRSVAQALDQFRVVAVSGPRQVGKSTLVESLPGRSFVSLDDIGVLAAASADPRGFVRALARPATIDEIQRVPQLLLSIKEIVDHDGARGQFLLTGSSRLDTLRGVKESLAGRAAVRSLRPLTWLELRGDATTSPVEALLECADVRDVVARYGARPAARTTADDVLRGGFPEPALAADPRVRAAWFREYLRTYIDQDVPSIVRIEDVPAFGRLLRGVAASTASVINQSDLARDIGLSVDTVRRWLGVLEATEVVVRRLPWFRNLRRRLAKSPKLFLADAGLAGALVGATPWTAAAPSPFAGSLLETAVHAQLTAYAEVADPPVEIYFLRTQDGLEIDFLLVQGPRMVAIEVKSGETVTPTSAKAIEWLADEIGAELAFGVVLYDGATTFPLAPHTVALPFGTFLG